jgi:hypothetical protein
MSMSLGRSGAELARIRRALREADAEGPLTAREIREVAAEHGEEFESAHRVATVLGRWADTDAVRVVRDQPYRYEVGDA